jgi:Transcription factor DP/E2F/DP family winged-helix DNA-binding domain
MPLFYILTPRISYNLNFLTKDMHKAYKPNKFKNNINSYNKAGMEKSIPYHISKIIKEIVEEPNKEQVLLKYSYLLGKDVSLMQIYLDLGFCLKSNTFARPVKTQEVLNLLSQEYGLLQYNVDSWVGAAVASSDQDTEIRQELLNFFYQKKINEIASTVDVGLEIPDGSACNSHWQFSTPQKTDLFFTPKLNKSIKSPSTKTTWNLTSTPISPGFSEESKTETPKSAKGLKHLTTLVKHFVRKQQPSSFKSVGVKLIEELIISSGPERVKEEKNIRRRFYDAINILIAAEVLEKDGRNVYWKEKWESVETESIKNDLFIKRKKVEEKKKELQSVLNKFLAIKQLIYRNSKSTNSKPAIRFPFIVVSTPDNPKNTMSIKINPEATSLHLKSAQLLSLFGDMDILLSLNMHKLNLSGLLQYLPSKDLLSYCSFQNY